MLGTIRAIAIAAGLLFPVAGGCGSDRAPDGKAPVKATPPPPAKAANALPAWSPVPADSAATWTAVEMARDPKAPALALDEATQPERAAWALARIGGPIARKRLSAVLGGDGSASAGLIGAIAFLEPPALGPGEAPEPQGPWASLEDALWTRYAVTESEGDALAILLAVARVGGSRSMQRLAVDTEVLPSKRLESRYRAALEAMGILCASGHSLTRAGLQSVATGLAAETANVQAAAAYALGRCAAPSAEQVAGEERARLVELVVPLTSIDEPDLQRLAWKALAGLGEVPNEVDPKILGAQAAPWLVEVEAVRALAAHSDGRAELSGRLMRLTAADLLGGDPTGSRTHVVLVALRALRDAVGGSSELAQRLRAVAGTVQGARAGAQGRDTKRLALIGCELALLLAIVDGAIEAVDRCADGVHGVPAWYGPVLGVEAILRAGAALPREQKVEALLARTANVPPQVAAVALSGLADVDDRRIGAVLRLALDSDDVGIAAAAATSIAGRSMDASRRDPLAVEVLRRAVSRLTNDSAVEARVAAVEALGSLARSATKSEEVEASAGWLDATVVPLARDPSAAIRRVGREALLGRDELLARYDAASPVALTVAPAVRDAWETSDASLIGIRLVTDAGSIDIDFEGAPAPLMQAVIADLVDKGFYEGLTIHRVVPGFVIQGGDPHADGYGGPGFIVPCERSTLRYERGTVGIALAGKDTGGSQFFIAQSRQPHLDARYPVIGRVVDGMAVVDDVLPHDRILRAEIRYE